MRIVTVLACGSLLSASLLACTTTVDEGTGGAGASASSTTTPGGSGGGGVGGSSSTGTGGIGVGGSASSSGVGGTGAGGTGAGGSGGSGGAVPPPPGPPQAGDGPGAVFAVRKLYLGDTDRNGNPDKQNGWRHFGFNIDGIVTDCTGSACQQVHNRCKPAAGGSPAFVYPNGDNGIDNSFGHNILPILLGIESNYSHDINHGIQQGKSSLLLDIGGLGTGDAYNPLASKLYAGAPLGHSPLFNGFDAWPVTAETLLNPSDITSARMQFPTSYVIDDTWVSGRGNVTVPLHGGTNIDLDLALRAAVVVFEMAPDHTSGTLGTISGVLDTEQFVQEFRRLAGAIDPSLCSGSTIDSITNQIRQASDIMKDGTAGSPSQTCNGISVGLGFDAGIIQLGGVAAPVSNPDPCSP